MSRAVARHRHIVIRLFLIAVALIPAVQSVMCQSPLGAMGLCKCVCVCVCVSACNGMCTQRSYRHVYSTFISAHAHSFSRDHFIMFISTHCSLAFIRGWLHVTRFFLPRSWLGIRRHTTPAVCASRARCPPSILVRTRHDCATVSRSTWH